MIGLAVVNVLRTPGGGRWWARSAWPSEWPRSPSSPAVTLAFRGVVVGSLLGNAVAVQVRGVDFVAIAATVALGVLAVADVVILNIRERSAEFATLRALGWPESALSRLVIGEALLIGVAGSATGAALGLAGPRSSPARFRRGSAGRPGRGLGRNRRDRCAAMLPARMLRYLPTAQLLAEE